jgi:hypothetical protein
MLQLRLVKSSEELVVNEKISHASAAVLVRPGSKPGQVEALAFLYTKMKDGEPPFSSWRFPTETGEEGETAYLTLSNGVIRELSETPDSPEGFNFKALTDIGRNNEPKPFLLLVVPGDKKKGGGWHHKCVFLLMLDPASNANLRKEPVMDGDDELLDPPKFFELGDLWKKMEARGLPFHRAVLFETIQRFAKHDRKYYDEYKGILEDPRSQQLISSRAGPIQFEKP